MVMKSSSSVVRLLCLTMMLSIILFQVQLSSGQLQRQVAAVYVLGDSTLDVGNNNYLQGVFRGNIPYYGIDHPGKPTGRFSNGYNIADFIAMKLGFRESPPPYLSLVLLQGPDDPNLTLAVTALTKGVSFASGGAGILDSTNAGRSIPLSTQLRFMEATKAAMVAKVGTGAVAAHLAQSFFLLSIGNNDIFGFAYALAIQKRTAATPAEVAAFYANLITTYSAAITELYNMGARKFAIINAGLVGCVPFVRVLLTTSIGACNDGLNRLAAGFNDAFSSLLVDLAGKLPGFTYSLADSYLLGEIAFTDPIVSGYTSVDAACCGVGRLGADGDCQVGAMLCPDRDKWAFWDRFHLSQRPNMVSAEAYYDGPAQFTKPINFSQLARITPP